jgi:hypothetical protein
MYVMHSNRVCDVSCALNICRLTDGLHTKGGCLCLSLALCRLDSLQMFMAA